MRFPLKSLKKLRFFLPSLSLPARAVMKRELLSGLRNPKPFYFLTALMVVMIVGLLFTFNVVYGNSFRQGMPLSVGDVRTIFMTFSMGLYLSAVLLVPPLAAVSICIEKQQDSFDLLSMTYIRPLALALAKLANVLGLYLLVVIATFPIVGVFFFFVGIDWNQFIISFTLTILSAISLASVGLLCSAWFYRTLPAIISTYILALATHGGIVLILVLLEEFAGIHLVSYIDEELAAVLIPLIGLGIASQGMVGLGSITFALIYHGGMALVCLYMTLLILRRPARPMQVNTEKIIDDQAELKARRKKFPYYLLDPRRRRAIIPDGKNPMLAKELATGLLARSTLAIRIFYGFTIFSFVVSLMSITNYMYGGNADEMIGWSLFVSTILILFITPTLVATAMAKEWEWQNVDSLRCTLLTPREIALGKLRTALLTTMLPIGGTLLGNFPIVFFGYDSPAFWKSAAMMLCSMVVCIFYTLALSFWTTTRTRRSITALMYAYGISCITLIAPPFIAMMAYGSIFGNVRFDTNVELVFLFTSPIFGSFSSLFYGNRQVGDFIVTYWLLNCLTFSIIALLIVHRTLRNYNHAFREGGE